MKAYRTPIRRIEQSEEGFPFFQRDVPVYRALNDPTKQILYRGTTLAKHCRISTNRVSMFLARRKHDTPGIYQSIWYSRRENMLQRYPKIGSYFVTLEVCKAFHGMVTFKRPCPHLIDI